MNNFEKIKNMTIDEMVEFILSVNEDLCEYCDVCDVCYEDCGVGIKKWLVGKVKEVENEQF